MNDKKFPGKEKLEEAVRLFAEEYCDKFDDTLPAEFGDAYFDDLFRRILSRLDDE